MDEVTGQVLDLVSAEPVVVGDPGSTAGWLQRLCRAAARDLPAWGVGVSLLTEAGDRRRVAASGAVTLAVEELQFTLGEGPCQRAHATGVPVLVPDLSSTSTDGQWVTYAPAAARLGVGAVFAFPLTMGPARLGALDVYRERAGELSSVALAHAAAFAAAATQQLLATAAAAGEDEEQVEDLLADQTETTAEIHQAQGMVMLQGSLSGDDALARMRAEAFLTDTRLVEVAHAILTRELALGDGEEW